MPLDDLQWSYRGLEFGDRGPIFVNSAEGFEGFDARMGDSDLARGDGAIRGVDYVAARTVSFELAMIDVEEGDGSPYEGMYSVVRNAFRPSPTEDFPLVFKRPGLPERQVFCRPIQLTRSEDFLRFNRYGFPPVVLRAADPRIYSTASKSIGVPVFAAEGGGYELPNDFPLDFGGGSQIEVVAVNDGTADAFPLVQFYSSIGADGPVYYPADDLYPSDDLYPNDPSSPGSDTGAAPSEIDGVKLTNTTTGDVLEINTSIVGDQVLVADMSTAVTGAPRLVISVDDASRYGSWALPRKAFSLAPGPNTLRFEVSGTSTIARCNVSWFDTWLD